MVMGMYNDHDDRDDMDDNFLMYVYLILSVVGSFFLLIGICICCKLKNRSTKSTIVYGGGSNATSSQGITTTQSVYHQYGTANRQIQTSHGTPMISAQPPSNAPGFPNPYYGNYSPQIHTQRSPCPVGNEFPQIPQQCQSQAQPSQCPPHFNNEACNLPPSYEEILTEVYRKQPAYNPNYTNNSSRY